MTGKYVLDRVTGKVTKTGDLTTWARSFEADNRRVDFTVIGDAKVSTVFLGIDHNFSDDGPPLLFETMVFGGELDGEQERCTTLEQAKDMHNAMVLKVKKSQEVSNEKTGICFYCKETINMLDTHMCIEMKRESEDDTAGFSKKNQDDSD